jgi:hypothetical protein
MGGARPPKNPPAGGDRDRPIAEFGRVLDHNFRLARSLQKGEGGPSMEFHEHYK